MESDEHNESTENQNEGADINPETVNPPIVPPSPPAHLEASENQPTPKRRKRITKQSFRKWSLRINGILAVAALAGGGFYYCQLQQMKIAAQAAGDSVKNARETAHLDQRAWVSTFSVPKELPTEGSTFRIQVIVKNTGRTFARGVAIDGHLMLVRPDSSPSFEMGMTGQDPIRNLLLAPTSEYAFTYTTNETWDSAHEEKIRKKGFVTLFYGCITYYDIFNCVHWTLFCFTLDAQRNEWSVYKEHNDADNDRCEEAKTK